MVHKLWVYLKPFTNWKFLISYGTAWMITNGWCWLGLLFGNIFSIGWMIGICTGYMAFLWMPFTVEKIVTIPLAIWFQTLFFKHDKKLRKQLEDLKAEAIKDLHYIKFKAWCIVHYKKILNYRLTVIGFNVNNYYKKVRKV